jgi:hypothetical protein
MTGKSNDLKVVSMPAYDWKVINSYPYPQWVRIMVSPVKGALPVRVDWNRRLADGLRGPWFNIDIELWNGIVRSPRL